MKINFKGQDGGRGGNGGDGGDGGDGQKGASSIAQDSWYNGDECAREPGQGGRGGPGGDAGYPGRGGDGGNGGIIKVFVFHDCIALVKAWTYIVKGGRGGPPGTPGKRGKGGQGGPQGDRNDPCPERDEYHGKPGTDGRTMDQIDPNWATNFKGSDGKDGDAPTEKDGLYELSGMPQ